MFLLRGMVGLARYGMSGGWRGAQARRMLLDQSGRRTVQKYSQGRSRNCMAAFAPWRSLLTALLRLSFTYVHSVCQQFHGSNR